MSTSPLSWQTRLFSAGSGAEPSVTPGDIRGEPAGRQLSARAAYQQVLHRRGLIVDIRSARQRGSEGEVAPHLDPFVVERADLVRYLTLAYEPGHPLESPGILVILLCQEGHASRAAVVALTGLARHRTADVLGGFSAWRTAGMPVASRPELVA